MAAPKGNKFWLQRATHGRDRIFKTAEDLMNGANEYFTWVYENPLEKAVVYQGDVRDDAEPLMRAMTIKGLCIFLGVNTEYLTAFESGLDLDSEDGKDFSRVITTIRDIIYEQKFTGAAAGLLNPNIIARDLGLKDKSEQDITSGGKAISNNFQIMPVTTKKD
jgi:hypothetical protein